MERLGYVFLPARRALPQLRTASGVRLLLFTEGAAAPRAADPPAFECDGVVAVSELAWEQPRTAGFPAGAGRKTLRLNADSERGFWVLGVLPHWSSPEREWHEFAEENYVIEGEIETAVGLMTPGTYLAHPAGPGCTHGPMRSRRGALLITRAVGPFATTYEPAEADALTGPWP